MNAIPQAEENIQDIFKGEPEIRFPEALLYEQNIMFSHKGIDINSITLIEGEVLVRGQS